MLWAWACVFFCKCSAHRLQTAVPGKQSSHEPSADELPWERGGMESCCSPVPSLLLSLSRAERCCAVLVTSSDKLVSAGSWLGGFGAPGQFPAGHRLVSLSGSLGAALVLGLRYCCFTVKYKLNSDTYAPMLS